MTVAQGGGGSGEVAAADVDDADAVWPLTHPCVAGVAEESGKIGRLEPKKALVHVDVIGV